MPPKRKNNKKEEKKKEEPTTPVYDSDEDEAELDSATTTVHIAATGNLSSHPLSNDLKFDHFSVSISSPHSQSSVDLIDDTELCLNRGTRYGLLGLNGSGKSTLLRVLGRRMIPIPKQISIHHLHGEAKPTDKSALEYVLASVDKERERLNRELNDPKTATERQEIIMDRLEELDPVWAKPKAAKLLSGLGFTKQMQDKATKDFSGGWRMRIALAEALFIEPDLLLLDEPSNHLDLETVVWLEEYLKEYEKSLIVISHSQDFLNNVCTAIIHLKDQRLTYYGGNYDTYVKTREELEVNQMKRYEKEQGDIQKMKEYIAKFGQTSIKMSRQAKSKEKTLDKMMRSGLTEKVTEDKIFKFRFPDVTPLPPPVLQFTDVSFHYPATELNPNPPYLFKGLNLGVDLDSRVALVGPNGAGKSTLLKLMVKMNRAVSGEISHHSHMRIGHYHQHLAEQLDENKSPLEWMFSEFPDKCETNTNGTEMMRSQLGQFGITGGRQTSPIKTLSDGLKSRLIFSWLAFKNPHILFLDEPSNHLDIETIDSLAEAINNYSGGVVLVSHDFRLIDQVAKEIWEVKDGEVTRFKDGIDAYKKRIAKELRANTK